MNRWLVCGTVMVGAMLAATGCCKSRAAESDPDDPGRGLPGASTSSAASDQVEAIKRDALGTFPAPELPAVARTNGAGAAYIGTQGGSLVKLENGKFSRVLTKLGWIKDITVDSKGTVWVASSTDIHEIKGTSKKSYRGKGKARQFDEIEVAADGTVWLTGLYGVSSFKNGAWKTFLKAEINPELKGSVGAIQVDTKGRVWIVGTNVIAMFDGTKWSSVVTNGKGSNKLFCNGGVLADKALYTLAEGGVVKMAGDDWQTLKSRTRVSGNALAAGPAGTFFAADYKSVSRIKVGSAVEKYLEGKAFKGENVQNLAADLLGRVWFSTDGGMTVIDANGKSMQWVQGTEPALSERVSAIFVAADGPSLPAEVGPVQTGTVRGKLTRSGKPVAGIPVEICASPRMSYMAGDTPCTKAGASKSATTGADGTYVFSDVPIGSYGLTYKAHTKWTITLGNRYCQDMTAGSTCKIPSLDVNR